MALYTIQPFGNDLVKMTLTGEQIRRILNQQWHEGFRTMLQISGLRYTLKEEYANSMTQQFDHFKANTSPSGLHILFGFIDHPNVIIAPDWGKNEFLYQKEELQQYYEDWETLYSEEMIFDCNSSGIPHCHAAIILVARKP